MIVLRAWQRNCFLQSLSAVVLLGRLGSLVFAFSELALVHVDPTTVENICLAASRTSVVDHGLRVHLLVALKVLMFGLQEEISHDMVSRVFMTSWGMRDFALFDGDLGPAPFNNLGTSLLAGRCPSGYVLSRILCFPVTWWNWVCCQCDWPRNRTRVKASPPRVSEIEGFVWPRECRFILLAKYCGCMYRRRAYSNGVGNGSNFACVTV